MDKIFAKIKSVKDKLDDLENTIQIEDDKIQIKLNEILAKLHRAEVRADKTVIDKKYRESIEEARSENQKNKVPGKIRVGRIAGRFEKGRKFPISYGYKNINVVSVNKTGLGSELSPFVLKDAEGRIFENIWQFSKIYPMVPAQKQPKSGWKWPTESHVDKNNAEKLSRSVDKYEEINDLIQEEYWIWRSKGMEFPEPIRFPVGFANRHECLSAIFPDSYEQICNQYYPMQALGYIESRKKIYCPLYIQLTKETDDFKKLKEMLEDGYNLQILDIDVAQPNCGIEMTKGIYGEDRVGSLEVNEQNIKFLLNNPEVPFGHGYVLGTFLLGKESWLY